MHNPKFKQWVLATSLLACSASLTAEEPTQNKVHAFSIGTQNASVSLIEVEGKSISYEYRPNTNWGLHLSLIDFEYDYEDNGFGYYEAEQGEGFSIEAAYLFYPSHSGFFYGGGLGGGNVEWNYVEIDDGLYAESDEAFGYEVFARVGYTYDFGPAFVTPTLQVGNWFSVGEEVSFYAFVGLSVGANF